MTKQLSIKSILKLGFVTFALFVGAGNIIFPPIIALQSGEYAWISAVGFLITAVGLPVITVIAMARVEGKINVLTVIIGHKFSLLLTIVCYLMVGPLFALPRTATVSFAISIAPLSSNNQLFILIYSFIYFTLVVGFALYPRRLLDTVGCILAPLKIIMLTILGVAAVLYPAGSALPIVGPYNNYQPFVNGFLNGYLTMDSLGAMVFSSVIINAIRSQGIKNTQLLIRYSILAGLIAGIGLIVLYITLFKLGSGSGILTPKAQNGVEILCAYVQYIFGSVGSYFLTLLITISCLVTAIGLICSCAAFFSNLFNMSYSKVTILLGLLSIAMSNLGLNYLISIFLPVLICIYPPCIVLILLSFTLQWWYSYTHLIMPATLVSFIFGFLDGIKASAFSIILPRWVEYLPLHTQGLSWILPTLITIILAAIYDRLYKR